jgi:hypothetical protein
MSTVNGVFTPATSSPKKKVMVALKGFTYSNQFMISWTMTLNYIFKNTDFEVYVVQGLSSNSFISRLQTLGLDPAKDKDQKAFQGMEYDCVVFIDPEMAFTPENLVTLIVSCIDTHDAVSGLYLIDPQHYFVGDESEKDLVKSDTITKEDKETVKVAFTGVGFFACRKKVIDALEYPYFTNVFSEEIAFCKSITEKGFNVMLNKGVRVGRSMMLTL